MAKINSQLSNDNILLRKPEPEDLDFLYSKSTPYYRNREPLDNYPADDKPSLN
mgnify:CR=1 FL=1